jgi:DNA-binding Xre family transcriptional regulator
MIVINIRPAMKAKGMTIEQLAEHADISLNTARSWYFGVATRIDLPILDRVCRVLNARPCEVLVQTDNVQRVIEESIDPLVVMA